MNNKKWEIRKQNENHTKLKPSTCQIQFKVSEMKPKIYIKKMWKFDITRNMTISIDYLQLRQNCSKFSFVIPWHNRLKYITSLLQYIVMNVNIYFDISYFCSCHSGWYVICVKQLRHYIYQLIECINRIDSLFHLPGIYDYIGIPVSYWNTVHIKSFYTNQIVPKLNSLDNLSLNMLS